MAVVAQVAVLGAASQVGAVFLGSGLGLGSLSNRIKILFVINKKLPNALHLIQINQIKVMDLAVIVHRLLLS